MNTERCKNVAFLHFESRRRPQQEDMVVASFFFFLNVHSYSKVAWNSQLNKKNKKNTLPLKSPSRMTTNTRQMPSLLFFLLPLWEPRWLSVSLLRFYPPTMPPHATLDTHTYIHASPLSTIHFSDAGWSSKLKKLQQLRFTCRTEAGMLRAPEPETSLHSFSLICSLQTLFIDVCLVLQSDKR